MERKNTYYNQLYDDYEKTQNKLDKLLEEMAALRKDHKKEISDLKHTIAKLTKALEKSNALNETLKLENEKLKSQLNKNSTNSSKPSSTNMFTPKKSGANLYNGRKKTNKKVGGQKGHKGSNLTKEKVEKIIKDNNLEVKEIKHVINGDSQRNSLEKYRIGLSIKPIIEKHIFIFSETAKEKLPIEFYTDVTYDNSIKSLTIELGAYNVISYDRLSDFFNVITDGILNISNGTLVNFIKEFSTKSINTIENITNNLLNSKTMHTDETSSKYNGKNSFVRVYDNDNNALYKAHLKKGHNPIKDDNILPNYNGIIIADHDTTVYKYGLDHAECNVHISRYLEEIKQNIKGIKFPKEMQLFLNKINKQKKENMLKNINSFTQEEIDEINNKYDLIIKEGRIELGQLKSSFYLDKAITLINRLSKYKHNHLLFAYDFDVDFNNNMSEQDLRIYKIKTKVSGGFRSIEGQTWYANALSIIKTSIKRDINPYASIKDIFDNKALFSN